MSNNLKHELFNILSGKSEIGTGSCTQLRSEGTNRTGPNLVFHTETSKASTKLLSVASTLKTPSFTESL